MTRIALALSAVIACSLTPNFADTADAQEYPDRTIKLMVPFPAGGATDTSGRLVAQRIQAALGQTVIVENQGGAGGTIGGKQVANAAPDGYTLPMGSIGTFGSQPMLYKLDYDPQKAFVPVATVVTDKMALVVGPSLRVNTLSELVQHAKANPGKINYGNAIGIGPQLIAELFKVKSGTNIIHIPYRGGAPMIADLVAGQIDMTINSKSVLLPQITAGKLRALAVTGAERWPELPDVPTMLELGYTDVPYDVMFGIVAPTGTPATVIDKLNAVINAGLRTPEVRASFTKLGIEPLITTPQEFAAIVAQEIPKWAEVVRVTGVKVAQ